MLTTKHGLSFLRANFMQIFTLIKGQSNEKEYFFFYSFSHLIRVKNKIWALFKKNHNKSFYSKLLIFEEILVVNC